MFLPRFGAIVAAGLLMAGASTAAAQQELASDRGIPGWVFTPAVGFGMVYDDNALLAAEGNPRPSDTFTMVRPQLNLSLNKKHTDFDLDYFGVLQRYHNLADTTDYSQGARLGFNHQATRRLSFFGRDAYTLSPSTDFIDVVTGVPFVRTGTRQNNASAGATYAATKTLDISGQYNFQWIHFGKDTETQGVLAGGRAHRVGLDARQRVSSRMRVGAHWNMQHANLGRTGDTFDIQNAEGIIEVRVGEHTTVEGGAGVSYLSLPTVIGSRIGPAAHVQLHTRTEHAFFNVGAMQSFVPAFGFGGSVQNSELNASARVPFYRRRAYLDGAISWRNSDPVLQTGVQLRSLLVRTTVGFAIQRWLHIQAFYAGSYQNTSARGQIDRNRVGIQIMTSHAMRIQ
jgi:hypothetical protein